MQTHTVLVAGPAAYEDYLVPVLFRPLADRLVTLVEPGPVGRVLDVACGTGVVARRAAAAGADVTGVGSVPAMFTEEVAASPLAEPIGALADGVREELVRDLGAGLADHLDDDGLVFPMEAHILTARA